MLFFFFLLLLLLSLFVAIVVSESPECKLSKTGPDTVERTAGPVQVYLTMTTTPDRIGTEQFRRYVENLLKQKPYELVLNVPYQYGRTGESYVIPSWLQTYPQIRVVRCEDTGPSTKILGGIDTIPDEAPVISVDDDLLYQDFLVSTLVQEWTKTPDELVCFRTLQEPEWFQRGYPVTIPEGYSGCITTAKHMKRLLTLPQFPSCRFIDDHWLGWSYYTLGIKVRPVSLFHTWYHMIDKAEHDRQHPWVELKNITNRRWQQRLCLNEIEAYDRTKNPSNIKKSGA